MPVSQTQVETQTFDLSQEAIDVLCDEITSAEADARHSPFEPLCVSDEQTITASKAAEAKDAYLIPCDTAETYIKAIAKAEQKFGADTKDAIAQLKGKSSEKEKLYLKKLNRLKTNAEKTIAGQKAKSHARFKETLAQAKIETALQIAEVKTKAAEQIARIKAETAEQILKLKDESACELQRTKDEAVEQIQRAKTQANQTIAEQKAKSDARIQEAIAKIKSETEDRIAIARAEAQEQMQRAKADAAEHVQKVKAQTAERIQKANADANEAVAKAKSRAEEMVTEAKARAADEVQKVKAEAADQILKTKAQANEEIAKLKDLTHQQLCKAQTDANQTIADQKAQSHVQTRLEVEKAVAESENRARARADEMRKLIMQAQRTIDKLKSEAAQKHKTYAETIAKLKAQARERTRLHDETVSKVKTEAAQEVAEQKTRAQNEARNAIASIKAQLQKQISDAKTQAENVAALQKTKSEVKAREIIQKLKAETSQRITEAEAKVRLTVAAAKAQAKEKARLQSEMVARIKAQAEAQHAVAEIQTKNQEHIAQAKAKAQAEADQTIAAIKSQTELQIAEIKTLTDLEIIRARSESEQKLRNYAQRLIKQKARTRRIIAKQKGRTAKKQRAYVEKISKIKSRTEKTAKDIMHKDILWARPDDSVEQTLAKMQDPDLGYALVGTGGVLEGVVSKSDLTGAISPYLRPAFAKWRRPLDDATLQIKIKWIMNRTVQTVTPDVTLTEITQNIRHLADQQPLVVTDRQGKVRGLITLFDITNAMLDDGSVEDAK